MNSYSSCVTSFAPTEPREASSALPPALCVWLAVLCLGCGQPAADQAKSAAQSEAGEAVAAEGEAPEGEGEGEGEGELEAEAEGDEEEAEEPSDHSSDSGDTNGDEPAAGIGSAGPIAAIAELHPGALAAEAEEAAQAEQDRTARLGRNVPRDAPRKPSDESTAPSAGSDHDGSDENRGDGGGRSDTGEHGAKPGKGKASKLTAKREVGNGKLPLFYDAAEMADLENPAAGVAVVAFRRSPVTGLLSVVHERALDDAAALERIGALEALGYFRWPPKPAPELTFGSGRADLVNCPFIIEALVYSDPFAFGRGEVAPRTQVTCAHDLRQLQRVVTRNVAIELIWAYARPCRVIMAPKHGSASRAALARGTTSEVVALRARCRKVRLELAPLLEAAQRGTSTDSAEPP
jgi:hypothetical protein